LWKIYKEKLQQNLNKVINVFKYFIIYKKSKLEIKIWLNQQYLVN